MTPENSVKSFQPLPLFVMKENHLVCRLYVDLHVEKLQKTNVVLANTYRKNVYNPMQITEN